MQMVLKTKLFAGQFCIDFFLVFKCKILEIINFFLLKESLKIIKNANLQYIID